MSESCRNTAVSVSAAILCLAVSACYAMHKASMYDKSVYITSRANHFLPFFGKEWINVAIIWAEIQS